jgi:arginyl-tRNA synthetase
MPDPQVVLTSALAAAIDRAFGAGAAGADPVVRPVANSRFGDYQANGAMALAKRLDMPARDVAEAIVAVADLGGVCKAVEVAPQGFVNLTLDDSWLAAQVATLLGDDRLGVAPASRPETVVVDYSSPNLAKEMHIGHLRSTVIGDALARVLAFLGHRVIRQNHVGDWGTQFGMLVEYLAETGWSADGDRREISDLNELYREAQSRFESDPGFADRARLRVVALQGGDSATLALWRALVLESERHFEAVYDRLGVLLTPEDVRGESFYNEQLSSVADELESTGVAVIDDGALCVFPPGFLGREGEPLPLIIRKSDGGFGYAATDLAAVVDARQSQHFAMVFAVARMAGWVGDGDRLEHVPFGTILGSDGRPYRTRSGDTVKLADVLDEAVERAAAIVAEKNPDLSADGQAVVAAAVGIGAVKYADLSSDRVKDYVFDWDRMLSFDGNTAAYLQNAYVRIRSIFRRAEAPTPSASEVPVIDLARPEERALALALLRLSSVVEGTADALAPHKLCGYLFDLAQDFTAFYEHCPVVRAETEELRRSRLVLCELTARVLSVGLGLLGIETVEQM